METITGLREKDKKIVLDGKLFVDCWFEDCTLLYAGGEYAWHDTKFVRCKIDFMGPASRVFNFMKTFDLVKNENLQKEVKN